MTTPDADPITRRPTRAIEINFTRFNQLAAERGWLKRSGGYDYARIAAELGTSSRMAYRVLNREMRPANNFIAGMRTVFDAYQFGALFRDVFASDPIGKE